MCEQEFKTVLRNISLQICAFGQCMGHASLLLTVVHSGTLEYSFPLVLLLPSFALEEVEEDFLSFTARHLPRIVQGSEHILLWTPIYTFFFLQYFLVPWRYLDE